EGSFLAAGSSPPPGTRPVFPAIPQLDFHQCFGLNWFFPNCWMIRVTVDYDGDRAAPEPASAVMANFLRRSFSVADVVRRALRGWLFGVLGIVAGFFFGVYSIWATPVTYSVSIGLLPTDSNGDVSLEGGGGGSGLAALAGLIGMGGGPVPKFTRFVASLNATSVAKIMDEKYDM